MNKENTPTQTEPAAPATFGERIKRVKRTRWIRFGIVAALYTAWVAWMGNWWFILLLPLLFDIYITGYIPFTWWKKSKSKTVRTVMSWVDAIVYALIIVYFVFAFIGQNYVIPTSSLEKTLLTGDYLWVNKMSYGPRVPMTPLHFPLAQNTLPVINTRSYIENPQVKYRRLKGLGKVKTGDIVVFNFPAGDTVLTRLVDPSSPSRFRGIDYYTLKNMIGEAAIRANKEEFGEVMWRPVDRRDNYVKRAVGLPGQTLSIVDGVIHIDGKPQKQPENVQFKYWVQTRYPLTEERWEQLEVAPDDRRYAEIEAADIAALAANGFVVSEQMPPVYSVPMTAGMVAAAKALPEVIAVMKAPVGPDQPLYPAGVSETWTRSNYGPLWIPSAGSIIKLDADSWARYGRAIKVYEGHPDSWLDAATGTVYIDGKPAEDYTFAMDYYFMMGDNRDNSLDSRYWGFVPEDHIVGKPMRVLVSFDKDKGLFSGKIRWNRIFKDANPGL